MNATATKTIKALTNSTVQCDGIRARVKREVFAAAVMPHSPERDRLLTFWHARQQNADRIFYANSLYRNAHPTKAERAEARDMASVGHWFDCSEARAERRQLGCAS